MQVVYIKGRARYVFSFGLLVALVFMTLVGTFGQVAAQQSNQPAAVKSEGKQVVGPQAVCPTPAPRADRIQGERGRLISGGSGQPAQAPQQPSDFDAWELFGSNMPQARGRAASSYWPSNGHVYVFGGRNADTTNDYNTYLTSILELNPGSGSWTTKSAVFPQKNTSNMIAAVLTPTSGVPAIYVIGATGPGNALTNTMYVYNPTADSVSTIVSDTWPVTSSQQIYGIVPGGGAVYNNKWYVFGGIRPAVPGGYTATWVYDPQAAAGNRWTQLNTANLALGRGYIASTVVDGYVYAIGGGQVNTATTSLSNEPISERLNATLANPTWQRITDLPIGRSTAQAFGWDSGSGYPNAGKVVVAGGFWNIGSNAAYIYDPANNTWSSFAGLVNARRSYMAAQGAGVFYAIGGYSSGGISYRSDQERYPAINQPPTPTPTFTPVPGGQWQINTNLNVPRFRVGSTTVGNNIYVIGGLAGNCYDTQQNANESFDATNATWTVHAAMPTARGALVVGASGNTIYAVAGVQGPFENGGGTLLNTNEAYDSTSNTWTNKAVMPAMTAGGAGGVVNNKLYVVAGDHNQTPYTSNTNYVYDTVANSWTTGATLPTQTAYGAAAALGGQLYHIGGYNSVYTAVINNVYAYDPGTNAWTARASLQQARQGATAFALNGELWVVGGGYFAGGGDGGFTPVPAAQSVEIYNPGTNTWRYGPRLNFPRLGLGGGASASGVAMIAAGFDGTSYTAGSETLNFVPATPTLTATGTPPTNTPTFTATNTPTITPTPCGGNTYNRSTGTATIVPGTTDIGNHIDDGITSIAIPFIFEFYDLNFTAVNASSNGNLQFASSDTGFGNTDFPIATFNYAILPHWDDLRTDASGSGIFTSVTGSSPNRIFNIEWRATYYTGGGTVNFEVRLYETSSQIDMIYGQGVDASSATVGIQRGDGSGANNYDRYTYNGGPNPLSNGLLVRYTLQTPCGTPAPTNTPGNLTATATDAPPTATATSVPPTATNTATPAPPTATLPPTNTATSLPSETPGGPTDTPTVAPTNTVIPPTATMTATATLQPIDTQVPTITPTDCPNPFIDLNGNVFYPAIHFLYCRGVVNGVDSTHYGPAGTATRAQFAKVVVLGFAIPAFTPIGGTSDFTDVPNSHFAYAYIETGYHASILSGYDAATCTAIGATFPCYGPNLPITRAQLTKLVVAAGGFSLFTPTGGQTFTDVGPSNVFFTYIETAAHYGIVGGYPDNTFRPNNNIRRDEMAQIVYNGITTPPLR